VLEDGTRVLSGREMQRALSMVDDAETGKTSSGARLSRHLNQKSLKSFIYKDKAEGHFEPLECYHGKRKINGYEATVLIDICDAFLQARKEIKLSTRQKIIADQCEILIRSFAKVGLIALIDEATGYQYDREKKELQAFLKTIVSDELLAYQQQFQLSFYREIYRLWDIPFTPQNIKRKPRFLGHLTNRYVYSNLPHGTVVLAKLKEKTPKTKSGNRKYKFHQSLTENEGRESLKKVLYSVEALASVSRDKIEFDRLINEKYGQKEIPFSDLVEINNIEETNLVDKIKQPTKKIETKKVKKKRADKYDEKLSIDGTLDDVLKVSLPKDKKK